MTVPVHAPAAVLPGFDLPRALDRWAVFLDIDGTLIDIAPTPESVFVPPDLPVRLERLFDRTGGAMSLVTGRSIATVDRLLAPARLPVAGIHGFEIRFGEGDMLLTPPPPALTTLRPLLANFAQSRPGLLLEDKASALAVHYRAVPDAGPEVEAFVRSAVALAGGSELHVQVGKMVVEVRPATASKGTAVAAMLARPAFTGRRPLALGDDVTDEAMFAVVNAMDGGVTVQVGAGDRPTAARYRISSPGAVRDWLTAVTD